MYKRLTAILLTVLLMIGVFALSSCDDTSRESADPSEDEISDSSDVSEELLVFKDPRTLSPEDRAFQILLRNFSMSVASGPSMYIQDNWVLFEVTYFPQHPPFYEKEPTIRFLDPATGNELPESRIKRTRWIPEWDECVDEDTIYYYFLEPSKPGEGQVADSLYIAVHIGSIADVIIETEDADTHHSYYFNFNEHIMGYKQRHQMGFGNFPDLPVDYDPDKYEHIW